ncbi:MAG: SDR family NAD(P)-dependent oxidoreductase [Bradymonadia bacterium]
MADQKVCVVAGVGPGLGLALVKAFAAEGYAVAALARNIDALDALVGSIDGAYAFACDVTDEAGVHSTFEAIRSQLGPISALMYNAGSGVWGTLDDIEVANLEMSWRVNTLGLFHLTRAAIADLRATKGALGITGATAALRGKPKTLAFASSKAAQRSMAQSFARQLGPEGVHVFYAIIDGMIDLPKTRQMMPDAPEDFFLKPDEIAAAYVQVAHQPQSAWTFELDLRPYREQW